MYSLFIRLRNFLYDREILPIRKLPVPVICVGNISVGGSGKTSLVRYIASGLSKDYRVGIVLRGYRRRSKGVRIVSDRGEVLCDVNEAGDEAYMLANLLSKEGVSVVVSEDRYEGGKVACDKLGAELIVLDDGFQHRRLYRDIDVVLLRKRDLRDRLLPFGRLREPLSSLERASCIVLSYQESEPFEFEFMNKPIFRMYRTFTGLLNSSFDRFPLDYLMDKELIAFAGLGDNRQFFETLKGLGFKVKQELGFRDHHRYEGFRLEEGRTYITTLKDMVKLPPAENLYALDIDISVEGLLDFIRRHL